MRSIFVTLALCAVAQPLAGFAQTKSVKAKVSSGYQLLAYASSDGSVSKSASSGAVEVDLSSGSSGRLYLIDQETGALGANVMLAVKKGAKYYTWKEAKAQKICGGRAQAIYGFKIKGNKLTVGAIKVKSGWGYTTAALSKSLLDKAASGTINSRCEPTGNAATLGYGTIAAQKIKVRKGISIQAEGDDSDSDGLINSFDADDDDDGIIDSYDPDTSFTTPPAGTVATEIKLFSNIKPEIQQSLNAYTETVTDARIDTLVARSNLAIQVAGGSTLATELDCGALAYCSAGGTGSNLGREFPEEFDSNGDGKGTITPGSTGDFQLTTGASKSSIGGGDVLVEEVTNSDGTVSSIPVMLNFIFNTTPAVASLTMGSTSVTPTYPASEGMVGTANNPFTAPAGWDKKLTITAYRPQRPGISGAGEGSLVDIGNSRISIDIPNLPCSSGGSGGCSGMNTSRCGASSYSESDANLSIEGEGLKDLRADQDTDTANPTANQVTFTVDVSTCISETWDSGEKLALDLQFSNDVGDNAAQKFYVQIP